MTLVAVPRPSVMASSGAVPTFTTVASCQPYTFRRWQKNWLTPPARAASGRSPYAVQINVSPDKPKLLTQNHSELPARNRNGTAGLRIEG
jgi:hypothetical protein